MDKINIPAIPALFRNRININSDPKPAIVAAIYCINTLISCARNEQRRPQTAELAQLPLQHHISISPNGHQAMTLRDNKRG